MELREQKLLDVVYHYEESEYNHVIASSNDPFLLEQLSPLRGNLVNWIPIQEKDSVLEVSSGYGAVTAQLVSKTLQIDCIDRRETANTINRARLKKKLRDRGENLRLFTGTLFETTEGLQRKYDYILLLDIPVKNEEELEGYLRTAGKLLNTGGHIYFATDNKYGLKYWAGNRERFTHEFFAGLEGYVGHDGRVGFSRNQLMRCAKGAGFQQIEFYYPYPDHVFPLQIFSDDRLPKKGELTNNMRNFGDDRMVIFDESRVFDNLIGDQMFPDFSNPYLLRVAG